MLNCSIALCHFLQELILLHDLIDSAAPGDEVEATGVYKHTYDSQLNLQNGFPVFNTVVQVRCCVARIDEPDFWRAIAGELREQAWRGAVA